MLTNPIYAGAYCYGKTETRAKVVEGRARKSAGHRKPQSGWKVLIKDHHLGYISWEEYERNRSMIAANAHIHSGQGRRQPWRRGLAFRSSYGADVVDG